MTIFNRFRLKTCSWAGQQMYYQNATITGGRKTVTHEYPDASLRYVEDLGKSEKTIELEVLIDINSTYSSRDKLIKLLENTNGVEELKLPSTKPIICKLKNYSWTENKTELGIARFNLSFEEASRNQFPKSARGNKGFLSTLNDRVKSAIGVDFAATFEDATQALDYFNSGVDTVRNYSNELRNVAQAVQGVGDSFADAVTVLNEIVANTTTLIQSPSVLAGNVRTAFDNLSVAFNSADDLFAAMSGYFGYNGADREVVGTSSRSSTIRNNQLAIGRLFQCQALSTAYLAAVNITYQTVDDLNANIKKLEDGYEALPGGIDRDTLKLIQSARIEAMNVFNNLQVSLPKISQFTTNTVPLNVLTYNLYGSLDLKNSIKNLNNFLETSQVEGTINILSNVE